MKVTIEDRNDDGRGRGPAGRKTALVSQAHPGETVVLRVDRSTRGTVQGRVTRLERRDERRIEHDCPHEFACTGCPLLACPPEDEAAFKLERVRGALAEAGAPVAPEPVLRPGPLFGYRCLGKQVFAVKERRVVLGSHVAGTHEVADNRGCPVLVPPLAGLLDAVAELADELELPVSRGLESPGLMHAVARWSLAEQRALLVVVGDEPDGAAAVALAEAAARRPEVAGAHVVVNRSGGNVLLEGELRPVSGASEIEEELAGWRHRIGPRSFFQVNPRAAAELVRLAVEMAGAGASCVEAFAGVGALTLPLTDHFERVAALESSPEAASLLERAARRSGRDGLEVTAARAEQALPALLTSHRPEAVVLDPPRRGLGAMLAQAVSHSSAERVVLLSCQPSTLARDLPVFLAGGWGVERVVPVDQFPRTAHVETVSLLVRRGGVG